MSQPPLFQIYFVCVQYLISIAMQKMVQMMPETMATVEPPIRSLIVASLPKTSAEMVANELLSI